MPLIVWCTCHTVTQTLTRKPYLFGPTFHASSSYSFNPFHIICFTSYVPMSFDPTTSDSHFQPNQASFQIGTTYRFILPKPTNPHDDPTPLDVPVINSTSRQILPKVTTPHRPTSLDAPAFDSTSCRILPKRTNSLNILYSIQQATAATQAYNPFWNCSFWRN